LPTSSDLYKHAYALHYTSNNYDEALECYNQLINEFPDSEEAGYAKTQIRNIENFLLFQKHQQSTQNSDSPSTTSSNVDKFDNRNIRIPDDTTPGLTTFFYILGILSIVGGIVSASEFWPDASLLSAGYEYKTIAYIPSIAWLVSGIISSCVFSALGKIIKDLSFIRKYIELKR
jgi:tetratricopeptide (TPR) repeat protein